MTYLVAGAARATIGTRATQEDAFAMWPVEGLAATENSASLLAVVADGMGGHAAGEVASALAAETFVRTFARPQQSMADRLDEAVHTANGAIGARAAQDGGVRGMGCTLVAAVIDHRGLSWVSVGDSLLLLCRFPNVVRLNADHSLGGLLDEQARRNIITPEEAQSNPHRHALRSALTGKPLELVDLHGQPIELLDGDWIVLASDGIGALSGDEISDVVFANRNASPEVMAERLIAAVIDQHVPDQDNTTVVAIHVTLAGQVNAAKPQSADEVPTRILTPPPQGTEPEGAEAPTRRIGLPSPPADQAAYHGFAAGVAAAALLIAVLLVLLLV